MTAPETPTTWTYDEATAMLHDEHGQLIASIVPECGHLAAAAPELLAACVQALRDIEAGRDVPTGKLVVAIAKARGGA